MANKLPYFAQMTEGGGRVSQVWKNYFLSLESFGGGVESVSGTANRITVTGTTDPVVNIATNYAGQTSITTLGTVIAGTWQGTPVATGFGGTGLTTIGTAGQLLAVNGTATGLEYISPPSPISAANPTASVGLTAVNGAATTYMRSDAAPPLDQGIAPTWTGAHTFASTAQMQGSLHLYFGGTNVGNAEASIYWQDGEGSGLYLDADNVDVQNNLGVDGTLNVYGGVLCWSTFSAFGTTQLSDTVTATTLAGTGTRLVTSTSAGLLGNDTTIAGNYTFSGTITLSSAPVLSTLTASRLMATNGSSAAASVSDLTAYVAGTANQITSTSDGDGTLTLSLPSAITFPGSGQFTTTLGVTGAATLSSTLGISGLATASGGLLINGGSFAAGRLYYNSTDGLVIAGRTGSNSDLLLTGRSGLTYMLGGPNTSAVTFPGAVSASSTLAVAGNTGIGVAAGSDRLRITTATSDDGLVLHDGTNTLAQIIKNGSASSGRLILRSGGTAFANFETSASTLTSTTIGLTGVVTIAGAASATSTLAVTGLVTLSNDLAFTGAGATIRSDTSASNDTKSVTVCGGGNGGAGRGASLTGYGNNHATLAGIFTVDAGNVATGYIKFSTANTERMRIAYDGAVTMSSTLAVTGIVTGTTSGGGSSAAFQAESASAAYALHETGATADEGWWDIIADGDELAMRAVNDANSSSTSFLVVTRTGINLDRLDLRGDAITLVGKAYTTASASGGAKFNLPHGAAPSSPEDGDMWTTSSGLYVRINGVTVGPLS